jgi:hypothetical protein
MQLAFFLGNSIGLEQGIVALRAPLRTVAAKGTSQGLLDVVVKKAGELSWYSLSVDVDHWSTAST